MMVLEQAPSSSPSSGISGVCPNYIPIMAMALLPEVSFLVPSMQHQPRIRPFRSEVGCSLHVELPGQAVSSSF